MAGALWYAAPEEAEIRAVGLARRSGGEARVRALWSGISRGTEKLIFRGKVPASEWERMRCPRQEGAFPFPVKYGYSLVGRVEDGSAELAGKTVFALFPHQTLAVLPEAELTPLPEGLPARRAVLAANMETALNAVWDAEVGPGDRVAVVGAGVVGCLVGAIAGRIPGCAVTLVDIAPGRAAIAKRLDVAFASPEEAPRDVDIVFHTSATEEGLETALSLAGPEATLCELSWYGDQRVSIGLGEAFHSRRLRLISSQVSMLPAARRIRWSHRRRLAMALKLLCDPRLDALITTEVAFGELPDSLPAIFADPSGLAIAVRYPENKEQKPT